MPDGVEQPGQPRTLDYSSERRSSPWRRRIVCGLIVLLVLAIGIGAYIWRDEISVRAHRLYWARQCMNYVIPPGTILVEYDRTKAKALAATNPDYVYQDLQQGLAWAEYVPSPLREYGKLLPFQTIPWLNPAVVFLGQRTSPNGNRRLVIIRGSQTGLPRPGDELEPLSTVLAPPTVFGGVPKAPAPLVNHGFSGPRLSLHPGVADPNDPSHVTIDFVRYDDGRKGKLDVYLGNDDKLTFKVRNPTTTQGQ